MLYKYFPTTRVDVLSSFKIRYTQLSALNDPFESLPLINTDEDLKCLLDQIEYEAQELWTNTIAKEKTPANFSTLRKLVSEQIISASQKLLPSKIGKELIVELVNSAIGVLSLSKTYHNLLMWSHYAEQHKGFVIGFDDSHEYFHQRSINGQNKSPLNVIYTTQRSSTNLRDKDYYTKLFCEKPIDWAYEEEVRVFTVFSDERNYCGTCNAGFPVYLEQLPKECIKTVFIGANASKDIRERIICNAALGKLRAEIFEAKFSKTHYKIFFSKVEIPEQHDQ